MNFPNCTDSSAVNAEDFESRRQQLFNEIYSKQEQPEVVDSESERDAQAVTDDEW